MCGRQRRTSGGQFPLRTSWRSAADGHNSVAMLVRGEGETLDALLKRLDKAIAQFYDDGQAIDEINGV